MRTTAELRERFLSFFESKGHLRLPSASLIPPADDPSTLFIVGGMHPMKRWFAGVEQPPSPRVTTVQKCLRAGGKDTDIDDVGSNARTASFFEMLGNFSFGDYFKDGAIDLAWEFVTEHMGFAPERLWATVFAGDPELGLDADEEAVAGWLRIGLPPERIVRMPRSENFWQAADTGPCGPDSEIFYDRGEERGCGRADCGPNCAHCDRYLEFWNLVFMSYNLREDGSVERLPNQNVDTGLGLERGTMLLQGVDSIFDTDGFQTIMEWIGHEAGVRYGESDTATKAHRVLTDHGRAMTFLVADGVVPSNEGRGYVLRRIIRRAVQQGRAIGLDRVHRLPAVVAEQMERWYPEVREHAGEIERIVQAEEERFLSTLDRGMTLFDDIAASGAISGEDAFKLHDTYGFPLELTRELARERGLAVDEEDFTRLMAEQRERSRQTASFDVSARLVEAPASEFVGYERTDVLTAIVAFEDLADGHFQAKLERSPFYPEGGGQVSDVGYIEHDETGARAELVKAMRLGDDQVLTFRGEGFAAGDRVRAVVPWSVRFPTMANHTATHLLHKALREVLGDHVRQAGSAVRPDKLRFDFTHPRALSVDERQTVERRVNEKVFENVPVRAFVTPIDEARRLGAMMLFGEKYGDEVRVVEIPGFSRELCGGTHVRWTAEIGPFVILSEGSIGSGTRRIEAVTSGAAYALLSAKVREAEELRAELAAARKAGSAPAATAAGDSEQVDAFVAAAKDASGVRVVTHAVEGLDAEALLALSDRVKQKAKPAAVVLGSRDDGRVHIVANFDAAVADRGVNASDVVKAAAALVGGGGGGRPTMARAGGRDPEKLPEALETAERLILDALAAA